MIQAVRLIDTESQIRRDTASRVGQPPESEHPGPGVFSTIFSVIALAGFALLAFHAAHEIAAHCTSDNVLDLMRACGARVVVR